MNPRHLLRMARLARNPPSLRRVVLVFSVVAACLAVFGLEWFGVLPDGFGLSPGRQMPKAHALP
ncbi:MAG: hypothetical protein R3E44_14890 [Paracoccaceae bacterium]